MSIIIPHIEQGSVELGVDADCTFTVSDAGISGAVMLTLSDGGGFTGFLMSHEEWPEIRAKIDKFIEASEVINGGET